MSDSPTKTKSQLMSELAASRRELKASRQWATNLGEHVEALEAEHKRVIGRRDGLEEMVRGLREDLEAAREAERSARIGLAELRSHSAALVELLADAWWVRAAEHLGAVRHLCNGVHVANYTEGP